MKFANSGLLGLDPVTDIGDSFAELLVISVRQSGLYRFQAYLASNRRIDLTIQLLKAGSQLEKFPVGTCL
jgi:hypothetical protein